MCPACLVTLHTIMSSGSVVRRVQSIVLALSAGVLLVAGPSAVKQETCHQVAHQRLGKKAQSYKPNKEPAFTT